MEHKLSQSWQMPKSDVDKMNRAFATRDEWLKKMNGGIMPRTAQEVDKIMKNIK